MTITRSVNKPRTVNVTPAGGPEEAVVKELQPHPEFALSRREIVKYIITPPAQRSADVQNLLRLDYIGGLRKSLLTNANKCKREADEAGRAKDRADEELKTALGVQTLDRKEVLEKANAKRALLGLSALEELTSTTSFKEGAEAEKAEDGAKTKKLNKEVALADLKALTGAAAGEIPEAIKTQTAAALTAIKALKEDQNALILARQHGFIETGLEMITDDACPLCDKPWDAEELREHLKVKLLSAEAVGKQLGTIREAFTLFSGPLKTGLV